MRMRGLATSAALGLLLGLLPTPAAGVDSRLGDERAYLEVFYPEGLPVMTNSSGVPGTPEYRLHARTSIGSGREVALFSLRLSAWGGHDRDHWVYLGVVESGSREVARVDLTDYIPTYLEPPAVFSDLGGTLQYLPAHECPIVHLHLWTQLSGSGAHSTGTDVFFSVSPHGLLAALTEVEQTERFGRSGRFAWVHVTSNLGVARLEEGRLRVIAETTEVRWDSEEGPRRSCRRRAVDLDCASAHRREPMDCRDDFEPGASIFEVLREAQPEYGQAAESRR